MKPTITKTMIVPRYLAHFQCIGAECPSTCCSGWRVTIDKSTFQRYKNTTDPVVVPILSHALKRNRHAQNAQEYGQIRLDKQGDCPLQDGKGLCQIHKRLGEGVLSDTCQVYPRVTQQFAGQYEQVLTLSCPEAARLALLSEDAFAFEALPLTARESSINKLKFTGGDEENIFATRAWVMQLLHTEALHISDRLAIVGLLCDQLESLIREQKTGEVGNLLQHMTVVVESGAILETLAALPRDEALQVQLFSRFLCERDMGGNTSRANAVFANVIRGLGADEQRRAQVDDLLRNYQQGCVLLERTPDFNAVMSRYFLNEAIRETFPWQAGSPLQQHRRWVVLFGVLRVMLAGYACHAGRPLEAREMVDVIWGFCRVFQHNRGFAKSIEDILERCQWNSLPQLLAVLK